MGIMTAIKEQWKYLTNKELTAEQRAFATLEAICKPLSSMALAGIPMLSILRMNGVGIPQLIACYAVPCLLSAAIG